MWFFIVISLIHPLLSAAQGSFSPTFPSPGGVFQEGFQCSIKWDADTTGGWKVTNIELMTGSNQHMIHLSTVATVDGTNPSNTSVSIVCPSVTPNSAIYFYQFTAQGQNTTWTTRFAISSATGATTPPPNTTQPDGSNIPWGIGQLLGTTGTPPPSTAPPGQIDGSGGANGTDTSSSSSSLASNSTSTSPSNEASTSTSSLASSAVSSASPTNLVTPDAATTTVLTEVAPTATAATPSTNPNGAVVHSFSVTVAFSAVAAMLGFTTLC